MSNTEQSVPLIRTTEQLRELASQGQSGDGCDCRLNQFQGWDSITDMRWPAAQMKQVADLRDPGEQRLQTAERRLADFLATLAEREGVTVETEQLVRFEPVVFDAALADRIQAAAQRRGLPHRRMTSGAGHDAQMLARIASSAMIFVPSRGGISHNPREHTDDDQLALGAQVLLDVVQDCLRGQ